MDYNDVLKIRETQRSEQERYDMQAQLAQSNIEKLLSTEAAKQITVPKLTEIESLLFKLKSELFSYIQEKGLIDGLVWNGALQPVSDRKIVITKDMIKAVTDSIYNKELAKLAGIEEGAEANKVIDVIFNDVSVLDNDTRVATITITPEDIKRWYESNENTNCYTDEEKELVATIPSLTEDIQNIEEEQTKQNERLDALEESQDEQDTRLDTIEAEQIEQNNRLDEVEPKVEKNIEDIASIKLEQTEQNTRLTNIEAEQVTQNNRLDSIELEQETQNANIELNKTNIEINKVNIETNKNNLAQEIEDRKHADEDIKVIYDAEIKRIDQVNEHLQHEVDQKVKDVLLDGISVCDENRNAQLKSNDISKILDVKVDGESVVNSDKVAEIDTSDICKVKDVEVDGSSVVENHIAKIDTTDFCKVKDVTVDGESVVNPDTKVAEIDLSDTKIDTATQINIDGSTSDILSVDSEGKRNITVNASELGVLEDVTLDGESTIRYSNASSGRTAVINSKVKDVQLDGKSIVDNDKIANIDTTTFGKVDDVKIDGDSVVVDKVANIDLKPYENDITDVQLDGVSIVKDKIANLSTTSFGEIKDVQVDGTTIVDKDTKVANLDTTNIGGVNLNTLKTQVDTNTNDIKALDTNYTELAVDVNDNTTNIETNTTRILTLENLQTLSPCSLKEADIAVFTIPKDSGLSIDSKADSSKTEGFYFNAYVRNNARKIIMEGNTITVTEVDDYKFVYWYDLEFNSSQRDYKILAIRHRNDMSDDNFRPIMFYSPSVELTMGSCCTTDLVFTCETETTAIGIGTPRTTWFYAKNTFPARRNVTSSGYGTDNTPRFAIQGAVPTMGFGYLVADYAVDANTIADLSAYIKADYYKFLTTT